MSQLESRIGLIAFLDILGYGNILENNPPEYVAETVFKVLSKAQEFTQKTLPQITSFDPVQKFDYSLINFISFSDSILISIDLRSISEKEMSNSLFVYLLYCSFITRMMHENGLPVRGAIDYGEYIMVNNFIAGLPIIESFKLGNRVEMEGVVLTGAAADNIIEGCKNCGFGIHHLISPYLVSMKDDIEEKLYVLTPSPCTTPIVGDLRQYVLASFWKHHKDIPQAVRNKVDNTEQYLRFLKTFHGHLFLDKLPEDKQENKIGKPKQKKGRKRP